MEYKAIITEVGGSVLKPSLFCESKTKEELIAFWGLNEADVLEYKLYQIVDGREVEL